MRRGKRKFTKLDDRRRLIHEMLRRLGHPTAKELHDAVRADDPEITLESVYRMLRAMADDGDIRKIDPWPDQMRFDATLEDHSHAVCWQCGKVADADVNLTRRKQILDGVTAGDFDLSDGDLRVAGLCADCAGQAPLRPNAPSLPIGECMQRLLEAAGVAVCLTDEQGRFTMVNRPFCELYGYAPEELIGRNFAMLSPYQSQAERDEHAQGYATLMDESAAACGLIGRKVSGERMVRDRSGKPMTIRYDCGVFVDQIGRRFLASTVTRQDKAA